jgi:hypothetical protein
MASGFGENRLLLVGRHLLDEVTEMNGRGKVVITFFSSQSPMKTNLI